MQATHAPPKLPEVSDMEMANDDSMDPMTLATAREMELSVMCPCRSRRHAGEQTIFMARQAISARGKEKQLEKELPWHMTPEDEKPLYVEAEKKQWDEHVFIRLLRRRQALECGGKKGRGRG